MANEYAYLFGEPIATHDDDLHIYIWYDDGEPVARIVMDQVSDRGGKISAEVSIYDLWNNATRPTVGPADINLLASGGSSGVAGLIRDMEHRSVGPDWAGAIQYAKTETVHHFREGNVGVRLGADPDRKFGVPFLIEPYIASSGTTIMYGEGGLAKSTLALAIAISVTSGAPIFGKPPTVTGPVVYFDYEDDESIHDARMLAMCRSLGLNSTELEIYHIPLTAKVTNSAPAMKRRVREHRAAFYILDSVGMGRGGDAASAEDTIRLFRTLRSLQLPNLAIDHMSRESKKKKSLDVDAFGSVYTMNSTRLAWALGRAQGPNSGVIYLTAHNTKASHSEKAQDRGIEIQIQSREGNPYFIEVSTTDALRVMGNQAVSVKDRMAARLLGEEEGLELQDLADELGIPRGSVESAEKRDTDEWFERVMGSNPFRVRLKDWDTLKMWSQPPESGA